MYISVDAKNGVVVKTPEVPESKVLELVYKKAGWILKKRAIVQESLSDFDFQTGSRIPYLGKKHYLRMEEDSKAAIGKPVFSFIQSQFSLKYNPYLIKEEYMHRALDEFYKDKAKERMTQLTEKWAEVMGVSYSKITFKKVAKRWVTC